MNDQEESQNPLPEEESEVPIEEEPGTQPVHAGDTGSVWVYEAGKIDPGYVLVNDVQDNRVYLMDKQGAIRFEWELAHGIGNDAVLLEDGRLLASMQDEDAVYDIGGYGGRVQIVAPDGTVEWDYRYSSEDVLSHHDIELLPNGNILILAWQAKTREVATEAGYDGSPDVDVLLPESLIEVNPQTDEIVWEWHSWDHLIQEFDETKANYGDIAADPGRIDINYHDDDRGDLMHANGIDYDPVNDVVYVSVNFYSEVWVIDHSTSTAEAASDKGGNFDKGGRLLFRFGNPSAYGNTQGERLFHSNHFPNILLPGEIGSGNLLINMNGNDGSERSRIYELEMPATFELRPDFDNEPAILWEFSDPELYSPLVGGAVRLPNGNTLITEGRYGYWEVTPDGEVVWQFEGNSLFWRGYSYAKDHPGVAQLALDLD